MKALLITVTLVFSTAVFTQDQPPPRHWEEITFDPQRKILVMYGGGEPDIKGSNAKFLNNVFEWDGKKWTNFQSEGPTGIVGHGFLYNSADKLTYLVGTNTNRGGQPDDGRSLGVWTWNGKVWKQINTECPLRRIETAYDPANNRILVYGKVYEKDNQGANSNKWELWEFKTNAWKKLSDRGPVFTSAFAPYEVSFDIRRGALVLPFWENGKTIIWEYQNEEWKKKDCAGACPRIVNYYTSAYHEKDGVTYLFSGNGAAGFVNDLWKWNGVRWTKVEADKLPAPRAAAKMEYGNGGLYMYGGVAPWGLTNELWQWKNGHWKLLNENQAMDAKRKTDTLKHLITTTPTDEGLLIEYGKVLKITKQYFEAEAAYKKAISLNPANSNHLFELLRLLYEQNKESEAEKYISDAITQAKARDFYSNLGPRLFSIKKYAEGVRFIEKANEIKPAGEDFYNLACGYSLMNSPDKAFAELNKAVENGYASKSQFETDTDLDRLKSDPRWRMLLEKLK